MDRSCPECARLWRQYAEATSAHIRLEGKLEIASRARDAEAMTALVGPTGTAKETREQARQAIHRHETAAHLDGSASQPG